MNAITYHETLALLKRFPQLEGWEVRVVEQINANPKATGVCYPKARIILLRTDASWQVCIHEISHALTADEKEAHGPEWRQCFNDLWFEFGK